MAWQEFLLSGWGMILVGVFLGIVLAVVNKKDFPRGIRVLLTIGTVGFLVFGLASLAGVGTLTATQPGTVGGAQYSVTAAAGDPQNTSNLVIDDVLRTIQVQVQCSSTCSTFDYSSGTVELNFTIGRLDTGTQDVTTTVDVTSVGLVPKSDGSGTTYPIVALNTDGTYKAVWEKGPNASPTTNNDHTTLLLEGGGTAFARINVTWNINAVAQQVQYDTAPMTLLVAGEVWTVTELLVKTA